MIDATQLVGSEGCAMPLTGKGRCCTLGRFGTRRWRCGGGHSRLSRVLTSLIDIWDDIRELLLSNS